MGIERVQMILPLFFVKDQEINPRQPEPPPPPKRILQTKHIYNKIKRTTIWFCGGGGWGLAVYVESEYLFPSNFSKDHLF